MPDDTERHDVGETHGERVEREDRNEEEVRDLAREVKDARKDREGDAKEDRVELAKKVRRQSRSDAGKQVRGSLVLMAACLVGLVGVVWWQLAEEQEAGQKLDLAARAAAFQTSTQVAVQGCEADRKLRKQYKIRGQDLRTLAQMQLSDEFESLKTLEDPSIQATFSPELLADARDRANRAIEKLNEIVDEIVELKVPDCDRLQKRLKRSEGRVLGLGP